MQHPPNAAMSRVLQDLCNDPANSVWIISSSGSMNMEKTLGSFKNMGLIAVNGLKVRYVGILIDFLKTSQIQMNGCHHLNIVGSHYH